MTTKTGRAWLGKLYIIFSFCKTINKIFSLDCDNYSMAETTLSMASEVSEKLLKDIKP